MRRYVSAAVLAAAVAYGSPATAGGEGPILTPIPLDVATCFYECADYPGRAAATQWQEVTTLMVTTALGANPFGPFPVAEFPHHDIPKARYIVTFHDGHEREVLTVEGRLSVGDIDEINVCRTLQEYGETVPTVGLASVLTVFDVETTDGELPPAAFRFLDKLQFSSVWNKNVLGRFNKDETGNEVFSTENRQRVDSIGKTTCAQTPLRASWYRFSDIPFNNGYPSPILIEDTGRPPRRGRR